MPYEKSLIGSDLMIPYVALHYRKLVMYELPAFARRRMGGAAHNFFSDGEKVAYTSGSLSKGAAKRLKRALELLVDVSPTKTFIKPSTMQKFQFKLTFATLTLPFEQGDITDTRIVHECLGPMLRKMRRRWGMRHYVWRAEKQKNGNLHFHITSNVYMPYDQLRDEWNRCLNELSFIDQFEKKHGHRHPNSTDIHSVRKVRDIAAYMVKYMSKETPEHLKVTCKQWDCSVNLKGVTRPTFEIDTEIWSHLSQLIEKTGIVSNVGDRWWIVKDTAKDIRESLSEKLKIANEEFIRSIQ